MSNNSSKIQEELDVVLYTKDRVPGGYFLPSNGDKNPFSTPDREWRSIPLKHDDIVVDMGAYVGAYSITCARFPVKKVTAYEPTPKSFAIMQLTQLPNLENINAAIVGSNNVKTIDFWLAKGIGVSNSIVKKKYKQEKITVSAVNYVEAVKDASIVKIDIEGGEYDIFLDKVNIVQPTLRAIIIDFHPIGGKGWEEKAEKIVKDMTDAGFETVIKPRWSHGWTSCGSWIRPKGWISPLKRDVHNELMNGDLCCGCGTIVKASSKALCLKCSSSWKEKHKEGYECCTV